MLTKLKHVYYGWVMVFITIVILATHALVFYSAGIFLRPVTMEFGWERGALSAAFAIGMLVSGPLGILSGRLSDKYGPRLLLTVNGILTGIGFFLLSQMSALWQAYLIFGLLLAVAGSCGIVPATSTIPRWFATKSGLAMGLTWTGIGLGGIIAPLLAQWLISGYGWRQAYIVLGLINLIIVTLLAQFLKQSPQKMGLKPYGETEKEPSIVQAVNGYSLPQAIKTRHFWMLSFILACFMFIHNIMITHIAPHAADIGISTTVAASIVSIFAATSLIGRNLSGFISDKTGARAILVAFLVIMVSVLIVLIFSREVWMFYVFAVLYGIAYGGIVPLQTLLIGDLFGLRYIGTIFAGIMLFSIIGGAIGAPLAGYIFDATESYHWAFVICAVLSTFAVIISLALSRYKRKETVVVTNDLPVSYN